MLVPLYTTWLTQETLGPGEISFVLDYALERRIPHLIRAALRQPSISIDLVRRVRDSGDLDLVVTWAEATGLADGGLDWLLGQPEELQVHVLETMGRKALSPETTRALWRRGRAPLRFALCSRMSASQRPRASWGRWFAEQLRKRENPRALLRSLDYDLDWLAAACTHDLEFLSWLATAADSVNDQAYLLFCTAVRSWIEDAGRDDALAPAAAAIMSQVVYLTSSRERRAQSADVFDLVLSVLALAPPDDEATQDLAGAAQIGGRDVTRSELAASITDASLPREVALAGLRTVPGTHRLFEVVATHPLLSAALVAEMIEGPSAAAQTLRSGRGVDRILAGRSDEWIVELLAHIHPDREGVDQLRATLLEGLTPQGRFDYVARCVRDDPGNLAWLERSTELGGALLSEVLVADAKLLSDEHRRTLMGYLCARLAGDARRWELFQRLADDFTGSCEELVSTAVELAGT